MKNEIVIINAFPNNEEKLLLLVEQLGYLKRLNKPILLISGCSVPEFIENKVDYFFINTENEIIGKDHSRFLMDNGITDIAYDYFDDGRMFVAFYWQNVNSTIAKNIKLGFEIAKSLGYKTAFYTEDDNIWKDGSFNYIQNNLDSIKTGNYKVSGVSGEQHDSTNSMIFTTFFFADIEYFCDKFTIPVNAKEWYNIENVKKYHLHRIFEYVFYKLLETDLHLFNNTHDQFMEILEHQPGNRKNLAWGINDRRHSEKNLIRTFFTVLPTNTNEKHLILNNQSFHLKSGGKTYDIRVIFDGVETTRLVIEPGMYYTINLNDTCKIVTLDIDGYGIHEIEADADLIKNNGLIAYKIPENSFVDKTDILNYVVGGRLGDFIQTLYVVQQNYLKTGKKGNVYITDNLGYGGDSFTRPLDNLYMELSPIINQQDYINKFEIFSGQTDDFINLNDWRLPHNLIPENFPWTNLLNKVYLNTHENLTYQPWINFSQINLGFKDTVVIHRASYRTTNKINWEQLIRDNNCVFVGFDESQYNSFRYKHLLPFHKAENLGEFFAILNGCKFYVGNQTGPLSMACAMGIPRLGELCDQDAVHYVGDENYLTNFNWVSNVHDRYCLDTINNFIKYEHLI